MSINAALIVILLGGWLFARIFGLIKLPPILGMVVFGILGSLILKPFLPQILWDISPSLKSFALIVILLRAGLGISPKILGKAGRTALFMSFIPCLLEGAALMPAIHWVFGFDWLTSGLTAFMLAAVSPAVIVPSMLDLIEKGYGHKRAVPSIILAGASLDDVLAITLFSTFLALARGQGASFSQALISLPLSIAGGILLGVLAGFATLWFLKKTHSRLRATERTLILLTLGMLLVETGDLLHIASLLCVMTLGLVILIRSELIAHELSRKFAKIWIFAEIVLFVLIGLSLDVSVAWSAGLKGLAVIFIGLIFRSLGVIIATGRSELSGKERIFCVLAYIPKATVQAALGGVALSFALPGGETILALAVVAILFTAPLGLFVIRRFGPSLLGRDWEDVSEPGV